MLSVRAGEIFAVILQGCGRLSNRQQGGEEPPIHTSHCAKEKEGIL